jgi:UDP-glucose 6-dehydrogenase
MRITMIGGGYVGLVSGACFAEFGTEVTVVETDPRKLAALRDGCRSTNRGSNSSWWQMSRRAA